MPSAQRQKQLAKFRTLDQAIDATIGKISVLYIIERNDPRYGNVKEMLLESGVPEDHIHRAMGPSRALTIIEKNDHGPIDLVITAQNFLAKSGSGLPEMTGYTFLDNLAARHLRRANMAVIFISGDTEKGVVHHTGMNAPDYYLVEFTQNEFRRIVEKTFFRKQALAPINTKIDIKDYVAALAAAEQYLNDPNARYALEASRLKGEILINMGCHEEAVEHLGALLRRESDLADAAEEGDEVEASKREIPWALAMMARALFLMGRYDEARAYIERAITAEEDFLNAYKTLAQICTEQGDIHSAGKAIGIALEKVPSACELRIEALKLAVARGDVAEETKHERFLATNSDALQSPYNSPDMVIRYARRLMEEGNAMHAQKVLQDSTPYFKTSASFLCQSALLKAQIHERQNEHRHADAHFRRALDMRRAAEALAIDPTSEMDLAVGCIARSTESVEPGAKAELLDAGNSLLRSALAEKPRKERLRLARRAEAKLQETPHGAMLREYISNIEEKHQDESLEKIRRLHEETESYAPQGEAPLNGAGLDRYVLALFREAEAHLDYARGLISADRIEESVQFFVQEGGARSLIRQLHAIVGTDHEFTRELRYQTQMLTVLREQRVKAKARNGG